MNKSTATTARCAICNGRIERVALQYGGRSAGRGWIHRGASNARRAQVEEPHAAAPRAGTRQQKGTIVQMPTATARKAAPAKVAPRGRVQKAAPAPVKRTATKKAAAKPVRGAKSEAMREMFRDGATVSEVAAAVGAHYSFAHGVASRMVEAGDLDAMPTAVREAKPKAKAKPAAKKTAKVAGRPTAARRAANRKAAPEPEVEEEDLLDEDEEMDEEEEYEEEE